MKILILSDTHGRQDLVDEVLNIHKDRDGVIFLGDGIRDISYYDCTDNGSFFAGVRGNCDSFFINNTEYEFSGELILRVEEYTVIMMHGHEHGVKGGIERAVAYAYERGADVLLFGHTHVPLERYYPEGSVVCGHRLDRPIRAFNPGSLGSSYDGSYGLMQIRRGQLLFSHGKIK